MDEAVQGAVSLVVAKAGEDEERVPLQEVPGRQREKYLGEKEEDKGEH